MNFVKLASHPHISLIHRTNFYNKFCLCFFQLVLTSYTVLPMHLQLMGHPCTCTDQQLVHWAFPVKKCTSSKSQLRSKQSSMIHHQIIPIYWWQFWMKHLLCCCARLAEERRKRKKMNNSVFNCLRVATLKWLLHIAIITTAYRDKLYKLLCILSDACFQAMISLWKL